jgi:hypothetical protein
MMKVEEQNNTTNVYAFKNDIIRMNTSTNILRFVLDSICFLQGMGMGYLNNPINNMKIALPTDHVHICEKPNALILEINIS